MSTPPPVIRQFSAIALYEEAAKTQRQYLLGEFALILAARGHLVGCDVLEQLADVAIGDV